MIIINTVRHLAKEGDMVDYTKLAHEFMEIMYQMRRRKPQKQLNDSLHGEQFVLFFISEHGGSVIPSEISNEMGISSARIAAALNSLEKKNLITRRIDINDRRRIIVELTDAGDEQAKQHYQKIMNVATKMLEHLGDHDAEELIRIMKKLVKEDPLKMCETQPL